MYGLYLKYFHKNDNDDDDHNKILKNPMNDEYKRHTRFSFPKNLKNESIPFQLAFFTVAGGSTGMLLFFFVYPFKRIYQSQYGIIYNRNIILERIVKPFVLTSIASYLLSFAAGVAFVSYNSRNDNNNNNNKVD